MKKIVFFITLLLLIPLISAGPGTGVDPILESVGLEKPAQWNSWSESQKFSYLQERGIYPENGRKYKGSANTDKFFSEYLGVEKPTNWDSLSFAEKQLFVNEIKTEAQSIPQTTTTNEPISWQTPLLLLLSLFIVVASFFKHKSKMKKIGEIIAFYALPIILLLVTIFFPDKHFFIELGEFAERVLIFLLFIKPLSVIFSSKTLSRAVTYRQELGLVSFWLFLFHAIGLILVNNMQLKTLFTIPYLLWGTIAGVLMILLAITSNQFSMKKLKRNWKRVQYLAYPALLGVLLHSSLATNNLTKFYVVTGLFILLKFLEFKKIKLR